MQRPVSTSSGRQPCFPAKHGRRASRPITSHANLSILKGQEIQKSLSGGKEATSFYFDKHGNLKGLAIESNNNLP